MLIVTIKGSFPDAKAAIHEGNKKGEAIEFRLDLFDDLSSISKLRAACSLPVIFTLRRTSQGGQFSGNEREREGKLLELLELRPDYVDLEYDCDPLFAEQVRRDFPSLSIICSYHDLEKTAGDLGTILKSMSRFPSSIYKIATYANSSLDALRMLLFVREQRKKGVPLAGMCMGKKGEITRILAPIVDSLLTYASLSGRGETAPGQLTLDTLEGLYHFSRLNRQTAIYALIGDPVDQSIGHLTYNSLFRTLNEDGVYVKMVIEPNEVPLFSQLMKQLPFKGFSVTIPLKEQVFSCLDYVDPKARAIGAINTLVKEGEEWKGFNTDAAGALDAVEKRGLVKGKNLVIIGAGGTAKALAFEALQRGGEVLIVNRTESRAKRLAHQLGCEGMALRDWVAEPYDILINTTSVGMVPDLQKSPILEKTIRPHTTIFDVICKPKNTYLLNLAQNKGCQIVYGYEMFARQGIAQLEIWLNRSLDREELMRRITQIYCAAEQP